MVAILTFQKCKLDVFVQSLRGQAENTRVNDTRYLAHKIWYNLKDFSFFQV